MFLLLLALLEGPAHGYRLMKEVEARSDGRVRLRPGTLYRLLADLLSRGWVEETDERPAPEDDDPRRRYYRLTGAGRRLCLAEGQRLAELVDDLRQRRLLGRPGAVEP